MVTIQVLKDVALNMFNLFFKCFGNFSFDYNFQSLDGVHLFELTIIKDFFNMSLFTDCFPLKAI